MQNERIGKVIKVLRTERKLTQKQLADKLGISDKAVSKWERGLGAPELSLIGELSDVLDVSIGNLLSGDLSPNDSFGGNMKNLKYYICNNCNNFTASTGNAEISCCGKKLAQQIPVKAADEEKLTVEMVEEDWYITSNHPMTKAHHISFVAFATGDRVQIIKQYPEWNFEIRFPKRGHGMLIWYCTEHGLFHQLL
ncbi:MAG: helix-turn-helix domain-containing protein [Acidaminobacter sp.]|uniref:helix-turn-helix domain-containing protein n=1 Tax=Acidaminobacter sp. TaxID=1872102 RepID=UPI00137DA514|nr:helix-turn-helix domain-containing protein [Acidaminobacter sp.]MZQ99722.1 helix-turn-helix domain-containing protein [Acidaminobacter sp.]